GYFELEKWGIPDYDELVFITSKSTLKKYQKELSAFRRVIDRAIALVRRNPDQALKFYFKEVPEADRRTETDAFKLTLPYYASDQKLEVPRWQQFADFALTYGLIKNNVDAASILWAGE
ncbi:MAG: ABC transporter substrate-binding protein, partial [Desulfobacterales bacterium]